jgi:hypothetical protein
MTLTHRFQKMLRLALLLAGPAMGIAASSDNQALGFTVNPVFSFTLDDPVVSFLILDIPPGEAGLDSHIVLCNLVANLSQTRHRITASLDRDMPTGTSLTCGIHVPGYGFSTPSAISATPADVADGIGQVNDTGVRIFYNFTANNTAAPGNFTRTITFTFLEF